MNEFMFRVIRRLRYEYLRRFENPAVLNTKQGTFRVPIGVKDPISRELFLFGSFELELMNEAMDLLRDLSGRPKGKGTIIDIGANNGITSIGMLVAGQLDSAVAIEPEPANFARLQDNVALNCLGDAILQLNCALSDRPGTLTFELSDTNYGDHRVRASSTAPDMREIFNESGRQVISVPADTLDNVLSGLPTRWTEDIAVVWIDVQGYEGVVFAGARAVLARGVPVVSEIWPYGIIRAGMTLDAFAALASQIWTSYWIRRRERFVRYPILAFRAFLDELGCNGYYENVIFTRD